MERLEVQKMKKSVVTENIMVGEFNSSGLDQRYYRPEFGTSIEHEIGVDNYIVDNYSRSHIKIVE